MNLSVVGSGPTLMPGNSDRNKYFIKEDFPVEYWPEIKVKVGFVSLTTTITYD